MKLHLFKLFFSESAENFLKVRKFGMDSFVMKEMPKNAEF